jgi:hypothetical protein
MSLGTQLTEELESEVVDAASREVASRIKEETINNIESADQGASGLVEYVSDIEKEDGEFQFSINHPTAPLHEQGGHIEPRYAHAMLQGYTRDEFYSALKDCNEWVIRKRLVENAIFEVRRSQ